MSHWFKKQREKQQGGDLIPAKAERKGGPPPPKPGAVSEYQGPTETVEGEIVAHRFWGLDWSNPDDPALRSVVWAVRWDGPTLTANVTPARQRNRDRDMFGGLVMTMFPTDDYTPPSNAEEAGIYALRGAPEMRDVAKEYAGSQYASPAVYGTVALSGVVIVGTKGYRAERATVRSLTLNSRAMAGAPEGWNAFRLAAHLAEKYGVDEPDYERVDVTQRASYGGWFVIGGDYTITAAPEPIPAAAFDDERGEIVVSL